MLTIACYPFHKLWNWKFTPEMTELSCLELRQIKKSYADPASQTFAMRRTPQEAAGGRRRAHPSQRKEGRRIADRGLGRIQTAPSAAA